MSAASVAETKSFSRRCHRKTVITYLQGETMLKKGDEGAT